MLLTLGNSTALSLGKRIPSPTAFTPSLVHHQGQYKQVALQAAWKEIGEPQERQGKAEP
jgi:hypothetical protein